MWAEKVTRKQFLMTNDSAVAKNSGGPDGLPLHIVFKPIKTHLKHPLELAWRVNFSILRALFY